MNLELEHASYGVDDTDILDDVSLTLSSGEIMTVIGPRGRQDDAVAAGRAVRAADRRCRPL